MAGALADAPVEEAREEAAALRECARARADAAEAGARTRDASRDGQRPSPRRGDGRSPGASGGIARFLEPSVIPASAVCGLVFFGYSSLLTFLTPYAAGIGLARAASVFFVVYALSMFVTRPLTGRAFDRRGARPVMVPAFASFIAGMALMSVVANDWMILGAALLLGFGVGTVQSCGLAMVVRAVPDERLSVANATFYIMLDAGVGVGPLLLGLVVPVIGYAALYLAMAGVGAVALALFLLVSRGGRRG